MRTHDLAAERTIAETRLRSITTPGRAPLLSGVPASFRAFRSPTPPHPTPAAPFESATPGSAPFEPATLSTRPTLDPGRPGVRTLLALAAVAVLVAGFFLWRSRPAPEPLPAPAPITAPSATPTTGKVTVHVAGKVRDPGVYTLPAGARVTDAITAAGGVRRGAPLGPVNLARRLLDGEQIMVGAPAAASATVTAPDGTAVLDLNSATQDQFEQLPGVGEVLASRIADYRTAHGGFTSVDQLRDVTGIGPRTFEEIKPKVRV